MAVHPGSAPPPALQKAESPLHWSVHDPEADQRGYLSAPIATQVSNSPHVSLLKPFSPSTPEPHEPDEPPPPEILDQPSVYQVKDIMDLRQRGGRLEYLVDWEGYGPEERSWVVRDDILDPMLLEEFHCVHPDRPAPRGRGRPRRRMRASGAAPGGGGSVRDSS